MTGPMYWPVRISQVNALDFVEGGQRGDVVGLPVGQRRLATQNTSFAVLIGDLRRQTTQRYPRDTDISLDHFTRLLGYSEQSVLTRACPRWFSASPTARCESG
ncbi:helix-turn-helix transcriptional regulator [Mycolicibacterium sphagni]|uniref:hypothetical protein n=1 Tax=Mycolicibacterium sphagni TaxID=1786 RepID=UPI0021F2C3CD|nr:hypothetical protein [Mycolicibacterium sphagni]MCV7175974.1 hypothetical protein [Mycolicibacterium sphagni]